MNDITNNEAPMNAADDMLTDLDVTGTEADRLRAVLSEVAGLANEMPEPSADVRAMLGGAVPLPRRRQAAVVVAAVGALALGGVSAAAAANRLPDRIQEVVADATGALPVKAPHPVKPVDAPNDAPGQLKDKPTPDPSDTPEPINTSAPGQIQKLTKPDPTDPGPARPADPGSHGRAHNDVQPGGVSDAKPDTARDDEAKATKPKSDDDDHSGDNDDAGDSDSDGAGASGAAKNRSR